MCLNAKIIFAAVLLSCGAFPAAAVNLSGYPCATLGMTQMADDKVSIIACLQTSTADATLIWKPMTPVYGLPNGNIGVGVTNPAASLDVKGGIKIDVYNVTCAPTLAGTVRYNAASIEYCDGSIWRTTQPLYEKMSIISSAYYTGPGTKSVYCPDRFMRVGCTFHSDSQDGESHAFFQPAVPIEPNGCSLYSPEDDDPWAVDAYCIPISSSEAGLANSVASSGASSGSGKDDLNSAVCTSSLTGTVRYNTGLGVMQYCNGSAWAAVNAAGADCQVGEGWGGLPAGKNFQVYAAPGFERIYQCLDGQWTYIMSYAGFVGTGH